MRLVTYALIALHGSVCTAFFVFAAPLALMMLDVSWWFWRDATLTSVDWSVPRILLALVFASLAMLCVAGVIGLNEVIRNRLERAHG